jgi:two-component system sensor histidine kinase BaeS
MEGLPLAGRTAPLRLTEMLHELADAWGARAAQGDVDIEVGGDPALEIEGNAPDLYRLLGNLIENALHHMPAGGRLTLQAGGENGRAEVRVADTGCGIPVDELPRVFDRFYRARGETGAGNGLGLSIARAIARAHHGELTLANRAGGGCEASLSLPLAVARV